MLIIDKIMARLGWLRVSSVTIVINEKDHQIKALSDLNLSYNK